MTAPALGEASSKLCRPGPSIHGLLGDEELLASLQLHIGGRAIGKTITP